LNKRPNDIPLLAKYFIKEICISQGCQKKEITDDALKELTQISWTGNIRELRNVIERLIILTNNKITIKDVEKYGKLD
jgi:DNA-binding NtrC family response regulator